MITEERLKELIKDNKPIYIASSDNGINVPRVDKYGALDLATIMLSPYSKQLYEKKSDWEFDRDFRNITRTETLKLPTWEEFINNREFEEFGFYSKYQKYTVVRVINNKYLVVETSFERYYTGDLSKENYIKACRLAKKLFLGEEV